MAINKESRWGNAEGKTSTIVRHAFHEILILFVPISSLLSFKMIAWDTGGCASSVWNGSILKPFVFELENSGRRDMRWPLQYKQADNSALDGLICQHSGELCSSWDRVFATTTYTGLPGTCLGIAFVPRDRNRPSKLKNNQEGSLAQVWRVCRFE